MNEYESVCVCCVRLLKSENANTYICRRKKVIIANVWLLMTIQIEKREANDGVCHLQSDDGSYFDWNDKRLHGSVWNKWRSEKTGSNRANECFWFIDGNQSSKTAYTGRFLLLLCHLHELEHWLWVYFVSTGWVIETFWIERNTHNCNQSQALACKQTIPVSKAKQST